MHHMLSTNENSNAEYDSATEYNIQDRPIQSSLYTKPPKMPEKQIPVQCYRQSELCLRLDLIRAHDFLSSLHFSLPTHPPTIHRDNLARDIATGTTSQEDHHALEVFWLTPPTGRNTCHDTGVPALVIDQCGVHVRGNVSRSNGVDIDTLGYPLVRQSLGELAHTTLGRGVGGHGDTTLESQERGNVDDGAPAAGGELGCVMG